MSVLAKVPLDKTSYSLFVQSDITNKTFYEEYGTLIEFEGTACLFYSYSNHRRAYVVTEKINSQIPLLKGTLPLVKDEITIIYEARARKIDLLKFALYNLEKTYGKKIFTLPISYWVILTSLIDSYNKNTTTQKTKRNIIAITDKYIKRLNRNENNK